MKKKCLIVCDDDTAILEVVSIILEAKGYKVIPLKDCKDYLKKIAEENPDLILMDIWMPNQDGNEITKRIKIDKKFKHIPIVLCSANEDIENVAKECGADGYIKKPFNISQIENILERYS